LLDAAAGLAADAGLVVLRATGSALEAGFAFGVVRQLLEAPLAALPTGEREALPTGPARRGALALDMGGGDDGDDGTDPCSAGSPRAPSPS